jgi:nucleotide-binding universal stress UspA family protein
VRGPLIALAAAWTASKCTEQPIARAFDLGQSVDSMLHATPPNHTTSRTTSPVANKSGRSKIVVGYDGSESARRALDSAAALAGDQTLLVVVSATEPYPRSGITIPANLDRAELRRRRHHLDDARMFLSDRGLRVETLQLRGDPAAALVEAAADADLAVVGSRRLTRLQRLVLGSVSSKVVHNAACDVLVVR